MKRRPRLLLLLPTTTYKAADLMQAAQDLDVRVLVATDEKSALEDRNPEGYVTLDFSDADACARRIAQLAADDPIGAVIAVDEETAVVASAVAKTLGLPHNDVAAARAAGNKLSMRRLLADAGLPSPAFRALPAEGEADISGVRFPCVAKPLRLAASRGVIRADDAGELERAVARIRRILSGPDARKRGKDHTILIEDYIPGAEVAVEGLLTDGKLDVLAVFDKPDPLIGPHFEETIYVTPSRLPEGSRREIIDMTRRAARALGLRHGPIHAELRINDRGVFILEIAARSIGGLCSRTLRFGTGWSLEDLVIRHALGMDVTATKRETSAAGVMMIPIPREGVLEKVSGLDEALATPLVEDCVISAHLGQRLVPPPEGSRYLGFLFARGEEPEEVEDALRRAHGRIVFEIGESG